MAKSMRSKTKRAFRRTKREAGVFAAADAARLERLSKKLADKVVADKDGDAPMESGTEEVDTEGELIEGFCEHVERACGYVERVCGRIERICDILEKLCQAETGDGEVDEMENVTHGDGDDDGLEEAYEVVNQGEWDDVDEVDSDDEAEEETDGDEGEDEDEDEASMRRFCEVISMLDPDELGQGRAVFMDWEPC